jgi:hypothetical protein
MPSVLQDSLPCGRIRSLANAEFAGPETYRAHPQCAVRDKCDKTHGQYKQSCKRCQGRSASANRRTTAADNAAHGEIGVGVSGPCCATLARTRCQSAAESAAA